MGRLAIRPPGSRLLTPLPSEYQTTASPYHLQGFHSPYRDKKIQKFEPPELSVREGGQHLPSLLRSEVPKARGKKMTR